MATYMATGCAVRSLAVNSLLLILCMCVQRQPYLRADWRVYEGGGNPHPLCRHIQCLGRAVFR